MRELYLATNIDEAFSIMKALRESGAKLKNDDGKRTPCATGSTVYEVRNGIIKYNPYKGEEKVIPFNKTGFELHKFKTAEELILEETEEYENSLKEKYSENYVKLLGQEVKFIYGENGQLWLFSKGVVHSTIAFNLSDIGKAVKYGGFVSIEDEDINFDKRGSSSTDSMPPTDEKEIEMLKQMIYDGEFKSYGAFMK